MAGPFGLSKVGVKVIGVGSLLFAGTSRRILHFSIQLLAVHGAPNALSLRPSSLGGCVVTRRRARLNDCRSEGGEILPVF